MAFLARAYGYGEVIIAQIGIPVWIIGVISGVAPVTLSTKITLKFHVMEILGSIDGLPAVERGCLFPVAVLARIRIGQIDIWRILWDISTDVKLSMTGIALHGGRLISKVVRAIIHGSMAASDHAVPHPTCIPWGMAIGTTVIGKKMSRSLAAGVAVAAVIYL